MKIPLLCTLLAIVSLSSINAADEKAFTENYKKAFEANDVPTLQKFLYTTGADPMIVGFYQMMLSSEAGHKISSINLVNLTPEEAQKAGGAQDSPDGKKVCLPLKPTKKLVVEVSMKEGESSSSSKSENFVAENDGKFVIPVPGPCK